MARLPGAPSGRASLPGAPFERAFSARSGAPGLRLPSPFPSRAPFVARARLPSTSRLSHVVSRARLAPKPSPNRARFASLVKPGLFWLVSHRPQTARVLSKPPALLSGRAFLGALPGRASRACSQGPRRPSASSGRASFLSAPPALPGRALRLRARLAYVSRLPGAPPCRARLRARLLGSPPGRASPLSHARVTSSRAPLHSGCVRVRARPGHVSLPGASPGAPSGRTSRARLAFKPSSFRVLLRPGASLGILSGTFFRARPGRVLRLRDDTGCCGRVSRARLPSAPPCRSPGAPSGRASRARAFKPPPSSRARPPGTPPALLSGRSPGALYGRVFRARLPGASPGRASLPGASLSARLPSAPRLQAKLVSRPPQAGRVSRARLLRSSPSAPGQAAGCCGRVSQARLPASPSSQTRSTSLSNSRAPFRARFFGRASWARSQATCVSGRVSRARLRASRARLALKPARFASSSSRASPEHFVSGRSPDAPPALLSARAPGALCGRVSRARLLAGRVSGRAFWAPPERASPSSQARFASPSQAGRVSRAVSCAPLRHARPATGCYGRVSRASPGRFPGAPPCRRARLASSQARVIDSRAPFRARLFGRTSRARRQATCVSGRASRARLPASRARLALKPAHFASSCSQAMPGVSWALLSGRSPDAPFWARLPYARPGRAPRLRAVPGAPFAPLRARSTGASSGRVSRARLPGAPPCWARLWARLLGAPPERASFSSQARFASPSSRARFPGTPPALLSGSFRHTPGALSSGYGMHTGCYGRVPRSSPGAPFWARLPSALSDYVRASVRVSRARLPGAPPSPSSQLVSPRPVARRLFGRASRTRVPGALSGCGLSRARLPLLSGRALRARLPGASSGRVSRARLPGAPPCRARLWARLLGAPPERASPSSSSPGAPRARSRQATGRYERVSQARLPDAPPRWAPLQARLLGAPWRASRARLAFKPSLFHIALKLPRSSPGTPFWARFPGALSGYVRSGRVSRARLLVCRARLALKPARFAMFRFVL